MSRVLKNACSSLVPKSCFANCALYAITLCLVLFVILPAWGGVATHFNGVAAELSTGSVTISLPSDIAVDAAGNVYIADTGNSQIVKINPEGSTSVLAISGLSTGLIFPTGSPWMAQPRCTLQIQATTASLRSRQRVAAPSCPRRASRSVLRKALR